MSCPSFASLYHENTRGRRQASNLRVGSSSLSGRATSLPMTVHRCPVNPASVLVILVHERQPPSIVSAARAPEIVGPVGVRRRVRPSNASRASTKTQSIISRLFRTLRRSARHGRWRTACGVRTKRSRSRLSRREDRSRRDIDRGASAGEKVAASAGHRPASPLRHPALRELAAAVSLGPGGGGNCVPSPAFLTIIRFDFRLEGVQCTV